VFDLLAADGAVGSTSRYVAQCRQDFETLALDVLARLDVPAVGLESAPVL